MVKIKVIKRCSRVESDRVPSYISLEENNSINQTRKKCSDMVIYTTVLKNAGQKPMSVKKFLKAVSSKGHLRPAVRSRCVCVCYFDNPDYTTGLKPFFDIDIGGQSLEHLKANLDPQNIGIFWKYQLMKIFPNNTGIAIATQHREDKLSWHLIVNGYCTTLEQIRYLSAYLHKTLRD